MPAKASICDHGHHMNFKRTFALVSALILAACVVAATGTAHAFDLGTLHAQDLKLPCASCHGETAPLAMGTEASLETANRNCIACHGDAKSLAEKIKPKLAHKEINPHASHLVEIDCVTCHTAHRSAEAYCNKCHAFDMPMPPRAAK
jgi:fumarate reductase flavoprotein subunit